MRVLAGSVAALPCVCRTSVAAAAACSESRRSRATSSKDYLPLCTLDCCLLACQDTHWLDLARSTVHACTGEEMSPLARDASRSVCCQAGASCSRGTRCAVCEGLSETRSVCVSRA